MGMSDADSESPRYVTCRCQHCDGNIEFDAAQLDATNSATGAVTGPSIPCPHCGLDTVLFVPQVPVSQPPAPKPEPQKAKLVKETTYSGGVEEQLDIAGGIFLALGLIGGVVALVVALNSHNDEKGGQAGFLAVVGFAAIVQGFVMWVLFRAGAEIIRLLKKSNGLKFTGKITQPVTHHSYKCSLCGEANTADSKRCWSCGAEFTS